MFNRSLKKESIKVLEEELANYEQSRETIENSAILLHKTRESAAEVIHLVEEYVNRLVNTPKEFIDDLQDAKLNLKSFEALSEIEYDEKTMLKIAGGGTAAGVATGVATAAFAPTAAMAVATTFGTASTGAAISGLSGAAATNAALAWIGGGALTAGGGGMAAGNAVLALAGPVGWIIGGGSLIAGGVFTSHKNKKAAIKAESETVEVIKARRQLESTTKEIDELKESTKKLTFSLHQYFIEFYNEVSQYHSYSDFSGKQKDQIRAIINNTYSLSMLFMKEIGSSND